MITLAIAFIGAFFIAFLIGWFFYHAFIWHYIDLIYYPLAAVGVALLFISADTQRELFEVNRAYEQQRDHLLGLQGNRPNVEVSDAAELLSEGVKSIVLVKRWVDLCNGGPSSAEARCLAVDRLGPHVDAFLTVARKHFSAYEDRLLATCDAGDRLLKEIKESNGLSSIVAEKLMSSYLEAVSLRLHYLAYESLTAHIEKFSDETESYVREIHKLAFKADDKLGKRLLAVELSEIEYGKMILRGLSQCITAPREELSALSNWKAETSTQAEEIARLERLRGRLKEKETNHPYILWVQLNLWPFALGFALSLKFAKGSAALRKARSALPNK